MEGEKSNRRKKFGKMKKQESPRNLLDINIEYGGVGTSLTSTRTRIIF